MSEVLSSPYMTCLIMRYFRNIHVRTLKKHVTDFDLIVQSLQQHLYRNL